MFSKLPWFTDYTVKKLEWSTSVQTAGFGAFLLLPGTSLRGSAGLEAAASVMDEVLWGALFLILGSVSCIALHNNAAVWAPFGRMATMMLTMLALVIFAVGFLPWSPGAYYFLSTAFLFCGNGFLAASRDAGSEIGRWRGRDGSG